MAQAMSFSEKGEKMELSQLKIPTHVSIIMDGNRTLGEIQGYAPDLWTFQRSRCAYGYL